MATFLRIVSILYLLIVWVTFGGAIHTQASSGLTPILLFLGAVSLTIPAAVLYAFGQVVDDISAMRHNSKLQTDSLIAMRRYYEPQTDQPKPRAEPRF